MAKRQRSSPEQGKELDHEEIDSEHTQPSKKARKDTNAAAGRSIFVRSLPASATSDKLTELFSQNYPLKHATVVMDTTTKQSKGYGFVTFADAEDAKRALEEFNGHNFQGRRMKLEIAQPRSRDMKSKGVDGKTRSVVSAEAASQKKAREEKMAEERKPPKLIIRNLPWSVKTPEQLEELFKKFGKVKHSTLPKVKNTQAGFGFVVMRGKKNAEKALQAINGTMVGGRTLAVDWAVEKDVWQSKQTLEEDEAIDAESDGGAKVEKEETTPTEEDDVANFMKNFGDQLESEPESDGDDGKHSGDDEDDDEMDDDDQEDEDDGSDDFEDIESEDELQKPQKILITDNSTTLFIRNLPFTTLDAGLKEHFDQFGAVRYARVVMDRATDRPRGTGFVCFFNVEDADSCFRNAPRHQLTGANAIKPTDAVKVKHSLLEDENADRSGKYTIDGRVLQISKAVEKEKAVKLAEDGANYRDNRDKDKRRLYLLSEGTVASGTPLYDSLSPSEIKMREDSAKQRKKLIQGNPTLHLSLTRLSIRNLPRNMNSKDLKALAREAFVGFATDVKSGLRKPLSKEESARGGDEMREAEVQRKSKGKGIVRQAKIVFEGREGTKVSEDSGAGRSRGYGFVEYGSHRAALMGLRWLNGHSLTSAAGKKQRLVVEFAIENAQVVQRRKENESKARLRSKEVVEARERGELPEKAKKVLSKGSLMKRSREGTKKGGRDQRSSTREKSFIKVTPKTQGGKGNETEQRTGKKIGKRDKKPAEVSTGDDDRGARRAQIIQKKRMMRRNRKVGA